MDLHGSYYGLFKSHGSYTEISGCTAIKRIGSYTVNLATPAVDFSKDISSIQKDTPCVTTPCVTRTKVISIIM